MLAAYAEQLGLADPLDGLVVGEHPEPVPPPGWTTARVGAATVNPHDLFTLQGVIERPFELPVILGCDGAGSLPDGTEVVFYPVLNMPEHGLRMLTDGIDGTFAPLVALPKTSFLPKPSHLTVEEAAGLGVAWLTAWRMLFTKAKLQPGERVLIQGATGGVATAATMLAAAAGAHVTVTSRTERGLEQALTLGADAGVLSGSKIPRRVDVVIETVGEATWEHSLRSLNPCGRVVVAGATTGGAPSAELWRLFVREISVFGSAMGSLDDFRALLAFVEHARLRPPVAQVFSGVESVPEALRALIAGESFGKLVVRVG